MTRPLASSAAMPAALFAILPLWALVAQPIDRVAAGSGAAAPDPLTAPLVAKLTGGAAVPPGDEDGTGTFRATLNDTLDQFCYDLAVDRIDKATAAAVHEGATGRAGMVAVPLQAPANGTVKACATVTADLAIRLTQHPERFYVSVANAAWPKGAVRGQLGR